MKTINEAKITLLSKSVNESYARVAIASFFTQLDPTIDEINDIKTAVSEAVTNAIVHAYKNELGKIYITLKICEEQTAYIKVRDQGCGIEDVKMAMEPMYTTAQNEERAGLGFTVMQTFMDKIKVNSTINKGTTIIMHKKISTRGNND